LDTDSGSCELPYQDPPRASDLIGDGVNISARFEGIEKRGVVSS
jgi:hypothetical protein